MCAWITRHFRAHGKSVTDELCQYLIFRTDGLMTTLGGEIDKIAAYQEGEAITRGAIDAVVIPALSAQTFDISDAVVNRDFEKALFKLQELYAMQTDPIVVLGAIGAQLRRLYYARVILSSGGGQKELMELTGVTFVGGATQQLAFHTYFEDNGRPLSMRGCTGYFSVAEYLNKSSPLITKTMDIIESKTDATDNILRVELEPSDTVNLAGKFIYQVTIKGSEGDVDIPYQGIMYVTRNIDKPIIK